MLQLLLHELSIVLISLVEERYLLRHDCLELLGKLLAGEVEDNETILSQLEVGNISDIGKFVAEGGSARR